ncbi:hypothetical protein CEE37_11100 [candidate division LCP-89 bacterium B3_LCP]|uniref:Bulb-type lectin domain-containing protein n=1 Tax=candidate division LCP-89 bacterium B3_LCP TaxID=2012998 RepID=A0A532UXZ1_UNCL8|nr:MAG: hypothetical protein CEE37_11100 [candidate division LCP-89 bacterium B3_LCP]
MKWKMLLIALLASLFILVSIVNAQVWEEWVAMYNGPGDDWDRPYSIGIDANGSIYVTGYSYGESGYADYATIKYDAGGRELWVVRYDGPMSAGDYAKCLGISNDGYIYVTGYSNHTSCYDYATVKYDSTGEELWVTRYNSQYNYKDYAQSLALDDVGNVYVTGYSGSPGIPVIDYDCVTIKYNSLGEEQWVATYSGAAEENDKSFDVAVDHNDNSYITGYTYGATGWDFLTIKYNTDGEEQWVSIWDNPGLWPSPTDLALDNDCNVFITGSTEPYVEGHAVTIKYNSDGEERGWQNISVQVRFKKPQQIQLQLMIVVTFILQDVQESIPKM